MGGSVAPDHILKELSSLWVNLAKEGDGGAGVLRACSMTLVVLAEESEDVGQLGETMAALMPEHPARTILARLRGSRGERVLNQRVYAQCWMPFGQRRQICCEQIEITASDAALIDLSSIVLPLTVPDLPVVVWCRSPRLLEMSEFDEIAEMADKLVLDSSSMPDAGAALHRFHQMVKGGAIVGDLAWTRLTRWREMLAQVFENREYLEKLPRVSDVKVEYGKGYETAALYMGTWLMNSLAAAGAKAQLQLVPLLGSTVAVELSGEGLAVAQGRRGERLVASVNSLATCTNCPAPSDYLLLREELAIVRRDPVFEKTLASAAGLAFFMHG